VVRVSIVARGPASRAAHPGWQARHGLALWLDPRKTTVSDLFPLSVSRSSSWFVDGFIYSFLSKKKERKLKTEAMNLIIKSFIISVESTR
jgi:hypothetical protein